MTRAEILDTARTAVTRDRAATHGDLDVTFGLIARLWSARLGLDLTGAQVALMMIDLKTARAWGNPGHADNWLDIAGYAACGGEIAAVKSKTAEADDEPDVVAPAQPNRLYGALACPHCQTVPQERRRNPAGEVFCACHGEPNLKFWNRWVLSETRAACRLDRGAE